MKCLIRMFSEEDKGVVFYETVINLKWQKHTVIECVPLSWEHFEDIPQYFKVDNYFWEPLLQLMVYRNQSFRPRWSGLNIKS